MHFHVNYTFLAGNWLLLIFDKFSTSFVLKSLLENKLKQFHSCLVSRKSVVDC